MRIVLQRVIEANVKVENSIVGKIGNGYLILVGVEETDELEDVEWLANKVVNMRLFSDSDGKMNLSIKEIDGSILSVSQFTLHASVKKGNRPSFIRAAKPDFAKTIYEQFNDKLETLLEKETQKGIFGANMKIHLINDGPVTIIVDSKNRE